MSIVAGDSDPSKGRLAMLSIDRAYPFINADDHWTSDVILHMRVYKYTLEDIWISDKVTINFRVVYIQVIHVIYR